VASGGKRAPTVDAAAIATRESGAAEAARSKAAATIATNGLATLTLAISALVVTGKAGATSGDEAEIADCD
jgi:hypothetical protein